jgi:three-Cys-motif partner protein
MKINRSDDVKRVMLDHSKAKVDLYGKYFSIFLNILSRTPSIKKIYLYDLMCGEGIYEDGSKGSPIVALETIKDHYFANEKTCKEVSIWFNDKELSEIEPGKPKIRRVEEHVEKMFRPTNVGIRYTQEDYSELLPRIVDEMRRIDNGRALIFVDPYGYKDVKPQHLKSLLEGHKSEVLLFLPISHMYRFADASLTNPSPANEPLFDFLLELFQDSWPEFVSAQDFISGLRDQFRKYLSKQGIFVDAFAIERDSKNTYALFFFTGHPKGFQAMLDAKWKIDPEEGRGFRHSKNLMLFSASELNNYKTKVIEYLKSAASRTNNELWLFGLGHGYLPKHTVRVLRELQNKDEVLHKSSLDGLPLPKTGFYIGKEQRKVSFTLKVKNGSAINN